MGGIECESDWLTKCELFPELQKNPSRCLEGLMLDQ